MSRLELKTGRYFEAVQSYLGLFLKLHGEVVAEEEVNVIPTFSLGLAHSKIIFRHLYLAVQVLMRELEMVEDGLGGQWSQLQHHLDSALCLATFFKSSFL